jgi:hypothetical protein
MFLYNNQTSQKWLIDIDQTDGNEVPKAKHLIESALIDLISCENLVVLTGLGTSLHVSDSAGKKLAPTMWDLWQEATKQQDSEDPSIEEVQKIVNYQPEEGKENIETLLSHCKLAIDFLVDTTKKETIGKFVKKAERTIHTMCDFLSTEVELDIHSDFLRRIARRTNRKVRTKVFTTNYDKCFETAGGQNGYVLTDGFSHSLPQTYDSSYFEYDLVRRDSHSEVANYIENVFHLYKLHGSVDWERTKNGKIIKSNNPEYPIMVYPRHNKYELAFEPPYLDMMGAFQMALKKPNTGLLIVGFGFNDNHLSEPIISAIRSNLNLKAIVCDPSLMPKCDEYDMGKNNIEENTQLNRIKRLIDLGDPRISLLNTTFQQLIPMVPDMVAEDEREKHLHRIQLMQATKEA